MTTQIVKAKALAAKDAAEAVSVASKFTSEIFVSFESKRINAKSLMGIIALGLKEAQTITISADGTDEAAALKAMVDFFQA